MTRRKDFPRINNLCETCRLTPLKPKVLYRVVTKVWVSHGREESVPLGHYLIETKSSVSDLPFNIVSMRHTLALRLV